MGHQESIIRLHFIGHQGATTDVADDFIYKSFCVLYDHVILDDKNPDVVIFGCFHQGWEKYDCIRIFEGTEHFFPNSLFADIMITSRMFKKDDLYYNSTALIWEMVKFKQGKYKIPNDTFEKHFCNFIYSNRNAKIRNDFFDKMVARFGDKVHSWGRHKKNITRLETPNGIITSDTDNIDILRNYKFSICFENSSRYDSFSEKVPKALCGRSLPIYWGGDAIYNFIKKEAFIHANDFNTLDDLVDYIEQVNNDEDLYNTYMLDNPFIESDFIQQQLDVKIFAPKLKAKIESVNNHKVFWKKGCIGKVAFKILLKLYRRYFALLVKKRKYFGGV